MKRIFACLLLAVALIPAAHAGRACEAVEPTPTVVMQALELAHRTRDTLQASGAQLALVARVGQDLSAYRLRYSHLAFAWRDHPEGEWTVVHELNDCGSAESGLFAEGLGNFFLDDMFAYEALVIVPDAQTQERLVRVLSNGRVGQLHERRYNMLSYAFSTQYQNSNQWVLETFAAASADGLPVRTREQAQAWLRLAGYRPQTVQVPALTRLGARMFRANVAFDDHPFDRRMAGMIDTVSVESVQRFVAARNAGTRSMVVRLN